MTVAIQPVLLCGGSGTRLWPMSRARRPKQFTALTGSATLFQQTERRVSGTAGGLSFAPPIVVGAESLAGAIRQQLQQPGAGAATLVLEPAPRNTAACAVAAAALAASPETLVLLLPCDHVITDTEAFHEALRRGALAAQDGYIVTFGVTPDRAETAYGYIKAGAPVDGVFAVSRFAEKPDPARAQAYLDEGGWTWNAGIFLFRADAMIGEFERHAPDILASVRDALERADRHDGAIRLEPEAFGACRSISLDHAIIEKTSAAAVVPVSMGWSDVGLWSAVWDISEKDEAGLAVRGDVTSVDSRDCLAITDGPPVMLAGVEDVAVIVQDGVVLVTRRGASASVKTLVETLKAKGRSELL